MKKIKFAVITCSDTRSEKEDTAGALLQGLIASKGWECVRYEVVKDERAEISAAIVRAADECGADVVLTCGGTGLGPRDVCEREVPGIAEGMRAYSMAITPYAMLSRALCMQRGTTLVINFPGSKKAAQENWDCVGDVLPHAVGIIHGGGH